ncbi:hypothetical protein ANCDUO_00050 [Ancylostoma duodenale]|uniref:G-protein coupled receptors family 1 profile domain-containing protein n=1 Tax=Ancylostoma duodenale TaxID=51022 RepID=A0A0C2HJ39_9BILA|nr:hypothetical protein ANCDUO_00050 [Ancylostoma duodenale]
MDAFPPVFHNIAMWLTVLLAGQRYVSISYPLHSRGISNVSNVRRATLVIAIADLEVHTVRPGLAEKDVTD